MKVTLRNGTQTEMDVSKIHTLINYCVKDIDHVSESEIAASAKISFYDGISTREIDEQIVYSAAHLTQKHPNYSVAAARLQAQMLYQKILGSQNVKSHESLKKAYQGKFVEYINKGIEIGILSPKLAERAAKVAHLINPENDKLFKHNGLKIVLDRYLIRDRDDQVIELPQWMYMRITLGLMFDDNDYDFVEKFYQTISTFDYMSSTPTLFNSGCVRSQLSSCYLTTVDDSIEGIFKNYADVALLSKWAGGVGTDWTGVRANGSRIKGTNGDSQGVIPWLNIVNGIAVAVNQGGKRKGSHCAYLETWHADIEDFLDLRKEVGDERRRTPDLNTANWIPDLFMKRVIENGDWTLFSPSDVPGLHESYGEEFENLYRAYEQKGENKEIFSRKIKARKLWSKMMISLFETGHPWITFKDAINVRNPQAHCGVVRSSNLCTEITLNSSTEEYAVCNIGSLNLSKFVDQEQKTILWDRLKNTIKIAITALDNVVENGFYPTPETQKANQNHRAIGLGVMGFQEMLYKLRIPYHSEEQVRLSGEIQEFISYYAIEASSELAALRGKYNTYEGSTWSKGELPIDTFRKLKAVRLEYGEHIVIPEPKMNWDQLRKKVLENGMRNSNLMAIAPTATISHIVGTTQGYEPMFNHLFVVSNLSGELVTINDYLVEDLEKRSIWGPEIVNALKAVDGDLEKIVNFPEDLVEFYKTSFQMDQKWIIDGAIARTAWIDQAQSVNLYFKLTGKNDSKRLSDMYIDAWKKGIKTTYYLRSLGATTAGKVTVQTGDSVLNISAIDQPKACLIADPTCEACQ